MNRKSFAGNVLYGVAWFCIGLMVASQYYQAIDRVEHKNATSRDNLFVIIERATGKEYIGSSNVFTNIGEQFARDVLGANDVSHDATKWFSVSNDASPSQTWTKLAGEKIADGFTRKVADDITKWVYGGDYAINFTVTFTSTADSITLQCAGIHWDGTSNSDNNMYAVGAFAQTIFNTNDNLTLVWVHVYDFND